MGTLHTTRTGTHKDAARALHELVAMLDRGQRIDGLTITPARLSDLIRRYVADPRATPPPTSTGTAQQIAYDPSGPKVLLSALRRHGRSRAPPEARRTQRPYDPGQPEPPDRSPQAGLGLDL